MRQVGQSGSTLSPDGVLNDPGGNSWSSLNMNWWRQPGSSDWWTVLSTLTSGFSLLFFRPFKVLASYRFYTVGAQCLCKYSSSSRMMKLGPAELSRNGSNKHQEEESEGLSSTAAAGQTGTQKNRFSSCGRGSQENWESPAVHRANTRWRSSVFSLSCCSPEQRKLQHKQEVQANCSRFWLDTFTAKNCNNTFLTAVIIKQNFHSPLKR